MSETRPVELHFQELFRGEPVEVLVNGREVARFAATTRMQISLAHIETLEIGPDDEVAVVVGGQRLAVPVADGGGIYLVRLENGTASVLPADGPVGYV